ncbi:MAG: L,D-transpeptidase family protein [Candidatus Aminicenantaceae bacterium]
MFRALLGHSIDPELAIRRKIRGYCVAVLTLILALLFHSLPGLAFQSLSIQVQEYLRNRVEAAGIPPKIEVRDEKIHSSVVLPLFYTHRIFRGAWVDDKGLKPQVTECVDAILKADLEGLDPKDYHLNSINELLENIKQSQKERKSLDPRMLADVDLLLTDAFLIYGSHLLSGRVNPESIDSEWIANRRGTDMALILENALGSNQIAKTLHDLIPPQPGYSGLRNALSQYREIAKKGGWEKVPEGPKMQIGDKGERVRALRNRLIATGEFSLLMGSIDDLFDSELEEALRKFQYRNGLDMDGIVGAATFATLNVPVEDRLNQIRVNMERWRWLSEDLGRRHIIVNIADFKLDVFENHRSVMTMRVVVGTKYRRTPVFSDKMTYLVLCPYWHIPRKIALQDKIPLISKDIDYFDQQKIKVLEGWGAETKEIDPKTIDWTNVSSGNFSFRFRQDPGPLNALGRVKFMFPNKFNVYLHDTPSRELFVKSARTFSSGCIRIEKPIELAEYLLRHDPNWTFEHIQNAIKTNREQTVILPEPFDVHLLYWTTWVDDEGSIHFRNDIYKRDERLIRALDERSPNTLNLR